MKRLSFSLLLVLAWGGATVSFAQESPENELEYVRRLREKGWNDLAKTKIEDLLKRNDPVLNASLPLELARITITSARQMNFEQRLVQFTAARAQLQDYIKKNAGKVEVALASVELARLTSYHGQALLSKAMREDDNKSRHEKARPAEAMFKQAATDLVIASKAIEQALADPASGKFKAILQSELKQIKGDLATNLFDQAKTYINTANEKVNKDRSDVMEAARKSFEALAAEDKTSEYGWLAKAWLMKCAMEQTAGEAEVQKHFDAVMKRKDDEAVKPAVRLVRYFYMQDVTPQRRDEVESIGQNLKYAKMERIDRLHAVQKEGENWVKTFPSHLKSYEGQGVLFELGIAYYTEAEEVKRAPKKDVKKDPKKITKLDPKKVDELYDKAIAYFDKLADLEGDLSDRARQYSMSIKFQRLDTKSELKTFDDNMMRAAVERKRVIENAAGWEDLKGVFEKAKRDEDAAKRRLDGIKDAANEQAWKKAASARSKAEEDWKKADDERKKNLKDVIKCLNNAIVLATSKTPVQKVDEARHLLSGAYLAYGDPYRAAIVAESLGRNRPQTRRTPDGAATAIATYSALQSRNPGDAVLRTRLQDLAQFVLAPENQRTWSSEPVTSLAHYHLAMSAKRDNDPKKAISHLEKLNPDFTDYIYTQGQLVFIAQSALEKVDDTNKKDKQFFIKAAKDAIERMPNFSKDDSGSVITMYFFAKMEKAKFLYSEAIADLNAREELKAVKKCNEMASYVKGLQAQFEQAEARISPENRGQIEFSMAIMLKYADLGIAEVKFRGDSKDRFDQVIAATQSVVNQTLAKAKDVGPDEPIRMRDFRVTGDILGLALRSQVQKGNVQQGKLILDALQRLSSTDGPATPAGNVVGVLLNDIASQIESLKKNKDKSFKEVKSNYSSFLDEIAKEYEKRGWDSTNASMIGHAYTSLELPCKASMAFSKVKPPASLDKKIEKKANETPKETEAREKWEKEIGRYWGTQIEYIRALRACPDKDSIKTAEKSIAALLAHPNARFQIQAMVEKNLILEESQRYREAYLEWQKILKMKSLTDRLNDKDVQKLYFNSYFYGTRTLFKTATLDPMIKDRKKLVIASANMIIKLEFASTKEGWEIAGPLFQELIKTEPQLKDEYDKLKADRMKKTSLSIPALDRFADLPPRSTVIVRMGSRGSEREMILAVTRAQTVKNRLLGGL